MNIQREIQIANKTMKNPQREVFLVKKNIKEFNKYINKFEKMDERDLQSYIGSKFQSDLQEYSSIPGTRIISRKIDTISNLIYNPEIVKSIYEKVKDESIGPIDYEGCYEDKEQCKTLIIKEALIRCKMLEDMKETLKIADTKKIKDKEMQKYLKAIEKNDDQKIIEVLKIMNQELQEKEKNISIKNLVFVGKFLKEYGVLEREAEMQNSNYKKLGLDKLEVTIESDKDGNIGVNDLFEENYLRNLSNKQLTILNAFWQNRYTKIVDDIVDTLFIYNKMNLWERSNRNEIEKISNEKILNILLQKNICSNIFKKRFKYENRNIKRKVLDNNSFGKMYIDLSNIDENAQKEYHNYFKDKIQESKNDLITDFTDVVPMQNLITNTYRKKDDALNACIIGVMSSRNNFNWGYIPEIKDNRNSIERDEKFVLIGFDYPGFNMPLRVHINKNSLISLIKNNKGDTTIPEYKNPEDFEVGGRIVPTNVLMPLTLKMESEIIRYNKEVNRDNTKYSNIKIIKHFSNFITKRVKGIKKSTEQTKYVDINSKIAQLSKEVPLDEANEALKFLNEITKENKIKGVGIDD